MTVKVGGALAVKESYSIYELFILDVQGNAISVGYGILNPVGMLVDSSLNLQEAIGNMNLLVESASQDCAL